MNKPNGKKNKIPITKIILIFCSGFLLAVVLENFFEYKQVGACAKIKTEAQKAVTAIDCYMTIPGNKKMPSIAELKNHEICSYIPKKGFSISMNTDNSTFAIEPKAQAKITVTFIGKYKYLKGMECEHGDSVSYYYPSKRNYWLY